MGSSRPCRRKVRGGQGRAVPLTGEGSLLSCERVLAGPGEEDFEGSEIVLLSVRTGDPPGLSRGSGEHSFASKTSAKVRQGLGAWKVRQRPGPAPWIPGAMT